MYELLTIKPLGHIDQNPTSHVDLDQIKLKESVN